MNALELFKEDLPTLTHLALVHMPKGSTNEDAKRIVFKELSNFEMIAQLKPDLKVCSKMSLLLAIKQTINDNLTLAPSEGLVYLVPSRVKTGFDSQKNCDIYEWVLTYDPTANGRLSKAFQSGTILDNKHPEYTFDTETGQLSTVSVEFLVPSGDTTRWDKVTFDKRSFDKWKAASAKKNNGSANANYTAYNGGIDPEFAGSKAIRHGLNKRGVNTTAKRNIITTEPKFQPVESVMNEATEEVSHEVISTDGQTHNAIVTDFNPNDL